MLMRFRQFCEAIPDYSLAHAKEGKIMNFLGKIYPVEPTPENEDIKGIDCRIRINGRIWAAQIKRLEKADHLTFEIKLGKNDGEVLKSLAELYIFYIPASMKLYFIEAICIKKAIMSLYKGFLKNGQAEQTYQGVDCKIETQTHNYKPLTQTLAKVPLGFFDVCESIIHPIYIKSSLS